MWNQRHNKLFEEGVERLFHYKPVGKTVPTAEECLNVNDTIVVLLAMTEDTILDEIQNNQVERVRKTWGRNCQL